MKYCIKCGQTLEDHGQQCPACLHEVKRIHGHLAFAPKLAEDGEGFEAEYFLKLSNLEPASFWFRSRNRLLIWALQKYFPGAASFMEIGCGTGFVLSGISEAIPELALSGSEIFSAGLALAAERLPGVELFQMDARHIPFRDEFDVIGAFDVLEHVKEDEEVLSQIYQATRKGGGILVTVPHHRFLWSQVDEHARHMRRYSSRELKDKVRRAGFDVVKLTSFVSTLLPLLVVSRFRQRLSAKESDPGSEFRIGSFLNATFERMMDAERFLVRSGISFPVGGSLLLVARRK